MWYCFRINSCNNCWLICYCLFTVSSWWFSYLLNLSQMATWAILKLMNRPRLNVTNLFELTQPSVVSRSIPVWLKAPANFYLHWPLFTISERKAVDLHGSLARRSGGGIATWTLLLRAYGRRPKVTDGRKANDPALRPYARPKTMFL